MDPNGIIDAKKGMVIGDSRQAAAGQGERDRQRLKDVCQDFEAIFLHELLKGLRRTVPDGGSQQEALYRSLLDEQIARACARRGLGLADMLFTQFEALVNPKDSRQGVKDFEKMTDKVGETSTQGVQ